MATEDDDLMQMLAGMLPKIKGYRGPDMTGADWKKSYTGTVADFVELTLVGHLPATLDDVSIRGFQCDNIVEQFNEQSDYALIDGNSSMINELAKNLTILNGQRIERITYSPQGVEVHVANGRIFKAKNRVTGLLTVAKRYTGKCKMLLLNQ